MAQVEPMDVDNVGDFDDKENSLLHSNVLPRTPCTEKGYEELDVSELNMKLRYSITPASSPMSKSFTANCKDNKTYSINEDSPNSTIVNNSTSLTRSLNSTVNKCDVSKSPKLPLQALSTDQYLDMNSTVRRSLDNDLNNITISINGNDIDENISIPSTSSSAIHTPEATTPTKENPIDGGSTIMRGLKSVLNMFRTSQSPIPPDDNLDKKDVTDSQLKEEEKKPETVLASTPKACDKNKENSSKRSSPLKESMIFNDDLERELQWKDDSTIIFKQEKIPIHKLFLQQSTTSAIEKIPPKINELENLNSTVEYMDICYNDSVITDKTMTEIESKFIASNNEASGVESDVEFLDCETTYTKGDNTDLEQINTTTPVKTKNEDSLLEVCTDKNISVHERRREIRNIANDSKILSTDLSSDEGYVQFDEWKSLSSTLNYVKTENVANDINKLTPGETAEEHNIQFEGPKALSSTLNDVKPENVVNDIHKLTPGETAGENNIQFDGPNALSSTLNDVKTENVVNDIHKLTPGETAGENNIQFEELNALDSTLNDGKSENIVNNTYEKIPDVVFECQEESNLVDEIRKDVTPVLEVSADNTESNNYKDKSNVSNNNDDIKLDNITQHKQLLNNLTSSIHEDASSTELTFDVTKPLNIVTDDDNTLAKLNDTSNNVEMIEKEKVDVIELTSQPLNSGILQICENKTGNIVHDHANTTLDNQDIKSECVNLEKNKIENHVINEKSEEIKNTSFICKFDESSEMIHDHTEDLENKSDRVEMSCLNVTTNSLNLNKQTVIEEDKIGCVIFAENEVQSSSNEIPEKPIEISVFAYNYSQPIDSLQLNDNTLHSIEPQVPELINNLPSDIPLPSDDDIEKDSLMDNFDIQNENVLEDVKKFDSCSIRIKDQIMDSLEPMDVVTQEVLTTNSDHSNEIIDVLPAANLEEIQNKVEFVTNFPTSNSETNNETVVVNESATIVSNNEPISLDTLPDLNKTETLSEDKTASIETNEAQKHINCEQNIKGIKVEENTRIINDDLKNYYTIDERLNENKLVDEEIVTSANSSPFVSVDKLDLDVLKNDNNLDEIESPFETKAKISMSPPISPKLNRQGYNINFDEIDDPFATKTNIRMSPPPESSPRTSSAPININQKKPEIQKRVQQQNRRKSQPERQKRNLTKKRFNSSYSCDTRSNHTEQISTTINENDNKKVISENCRTQINSVTTTVADDQIVADNIKPIDDKCELDNVNTSDNNLFNPNETVIIQDESKPLNTDIIKDTSTVQSSTTANDFAIKFPPKNVFNLPEIDDMNFNPFVSKSKIRNSPSPTFEIETVLLEENNLTADPINEMTQKSVANTTVNIESQEDKIELPDLSSETIFSKDIDKDVTVKEIATEDEDTVEGPFLEAEEFADVVKVSDFVSDRDMMQFEDFQTAVNPEIKDEGELFIDAEAFEFLLNQNKSNVVADSGKESLFLKFDPLFAKRVSSDGVLAALNRIQKRQSTPQKAPSTSNQNVAISEEIPLVSATNCNTLLEESNDENNITVTKPMMVVNPAINSLVSPRKSTTPPRINRRSLTFTSPAMAVIDRLLSLSGNSSTLDQDASPPRINREYNDTDIALTQLRELLAEKEIHVHNLRSESKELKERLAVMESQVKTLEKESEERLKKVNDLNERLAEKTKINKSMAVVVEEYERTIASLIAEMDQEKRRNAEERARIISERDEQTAHLSSMEVSFSDLHSKYEKSKQIIISMKANEDTYKKSLKDFEENLLKMQNNYELLKQHATSKLNHANQELEKFNRAHESEVLKLNAMIKRKELHITSLEESLAQKTKANEELTAICDELINKVG